MQEKSLTKANLEMKNFRFYDRFAKTKPSYRMMNFFCIKINFMYES